MVYDCILFNDELELLELRLNYLNKLVDKFVIVESAYTFSGIPKPLHFKNNRHKFSTFESKICYIADLDEPDLTSAWFNEYHQRNSLKNGLKDAYNTDLIVITDLDEIPYLSLVFEDFQLDIPQIIPMSVSYYFLNCVQNNAVWNKAIITPYQFIKDIDIGNREALISQLNINLNYNTVYGGHFSYLFCYDIKRYIKKIKSFSHQEYNNGYFLNIKRIQYCINNNIDIFERYTHSYKIDKTIINAELLKYIHVLRLDYLLKSKSNLLNLIFNPKELLFNIKNKSLSIIYIKKEKHPILKMLINKLRN